jgi:enamine deaminase RidA (YjgF/YER057c/UK114 family)
MRRAAHTGTTQAGTNLMTSTMFYCGITAALAAMILPQPGGVQLRSIEGDPASGTARAMIVERGALVHTAMMFPEDAGGRLHGGDDPRTQAVRVLANLELALTAAGTSLDHLVRLHVYVADASITPRIDGLLTEQWRGRERKPAVTLVESAMPRPGVLVAMDAIAATAPAGEPGRPAYFTAAGLPQRTPRASHAAIQPPGPFVIVSGRAARGEFDAAVRETMAQLGGDLEKVGLTFEHAVQIKTFLSDMRQADRLEAIVAEAFGAGRVPPQVVTEWRQDAIPAEIELIASAPRQQGGLARVELIEPIGGRFSRVARVDGGNLVFLSGLYGSAADPAAQVDEMFAELARLLKEAGSDMRHLVKATYYVADRAADDRINAIRPTVYDPERPPAASKLNVRGTGRPGKASTFDMIAVTTGP